MFFGLKIHLLVPVALFLLGFYCYSDADADRQGKLGPVGLNFLINGNELQVKKVHSGSPAHGVIKTGEVITAINDNPVLVTEDDGVLFGDFKRLASFITEAEATDGTLMLTLHSPTDNVSRTTTLKIPVLGVYNEGSLDGVKGEVIVRNNADAIRKSFIWKKPVGRGKNRRFIEINQLAEPKLPNGYAILMLLSTGDRYDLEFVRYAFQVKMLDFKKEEIGSHTWNNGVFGIAACEYYLRTGDESVMPLINAICESGRKYQTHGGWTQRAKGIQPQYGLVNAAGTQMLTALLLAKQCGANVDQGALEASVRFFYRFAGHGNSPYGDNRPELGLVNNGKNAMLSIAMGQAAKAIDGEAYSLARDKAAYTSLHSYPVMLKGHSGPYGLLWYGISAALLKDSQPKLYGEWVEQTRWFYELSRQHDGLFSANCTGNFNTTQYGYALGLALTAPRKTLQITGAPTSPFSKKFNLPKRPWGRESDLAYHTLTSEVSYEKTKVAPHVQWQNFENANEGELKKLASHPLQAYRDRAAYFIRKKELLSLTEDLLESSDPLARNTACTVINGYEPRNKLYSIGTRARYSLSPKQFSDRMFRGIAAILNDKNEPLWNVDHALLALAAATPEQVKSQIKTITPWLHQDEWWLQEAACIALTPVLKDEQLAAVIMPHLIQAISGTLHARARKNMTFFVNRSVQEASDDVRGQVAQAFAKIIEDIPNVKDPEPGVDYSGITSCALLGASIELIGRHGKVLEGAQLVGQRIKEMRYREQVILLNLLIKSSESMNGEERKELGRVLHRYFRPALIGNDPEAFRKSVLTINGAPSARLDAVLTIDQLSGIGNNWKIIGNNTDGKQEWWLTSCPFGKAPQKAIRENRVKITLPFDLENWYKSEYDPALHGWLAGTNSVGETTPDLRRPEDIWYEDLFSPKGEIMLMRKEFTVSDLNFALMRVTVFTNGNYSVYLNGQKIKEAGVSIPSWNARRFYLTEKTLQHLNFGRNVVAVSSVLEPSKRPFGFDFYVETLKALPKAPKETVSVATP